jgi:hypothetical protein
MTPLASGTLFDRLVARTARPERAAAIPSPQVPAPVFDPFASPREEYSERVAVPSRSSASAADGADFTLDGLLPATSNANDDMERRRMASQSHIQPPRRSTIASGTRSTVDYATADPASGIEAAEGIRHATTTATQRRRVSTTAIRADVAPDDRPESRRGSEGRRAPDATPTTRGERLTTIRPPLDRWATFDDRPSPDDAGPEARATGRGAAIVNPSIGRATPSARQWPDEHSSVVRPDLPIAIPPRATQTATPATVTQEPIVHVTIGRLEIRGSDRNTALRSRERPAAAAAAGSLDQYLASRRGGAS